MILGREKYFFAGGNTPYGFVNFFSDISTKDDDKLYILKGGPGTGKSNLMKNISKAAVLDGYDVENILCSSDPDSFDGIRIPELGKIIIDGTLPHSMDMIFPGIRDRIINLADFLNEDPLKKDSDTILDLSSQKASLYSRAYNYLKAAKSIQENIDNVMEESFSKGKLNIFIQTLCNNFFEDIDISLKNGYIRRMFGTALTSAGQISKLSSLFNGLKTYAIKCDHGRSGSYVIEQLQNEAVKRGFIVWSLRCPFAPSQPDHIIIPKLSIAFTIHNKYHTETECDIYGEYLIDSYHNDLIIYDLGQIQELLNKATNCFEEIRLIHKKIEGYYTPNMNFEYIDHLCDNLKEEIFN